MNDDELKQIEADLSHWSTVGGEATIQSLVAEVRRLRGLVKEVEWDRQGDPHWTACPWGCIVKTNWDAEEDSDGRVTGAHGYVHDDDCPAFTPDGTVR